MGCESVRRRMGLGCGLCKDLGGAGGNGGGHGGCRGPGVQDRAGSWQESGGLGAGVWGWCAQRGGFGGQRDSGRGPLVRRVQLALPWPESPWVPLRVRILHQGQTLREVRANITVEVKPSVPPRAQQLRCPPCQD